MAKTGDGRQLGTAEHALLTRAAHSLHAEDPVLDDPWAVELLAPETQRVARDPARYESPRESPISPLFATGIGSLRYAEDEVERCLRRGTRQYVVLGAGFDSFALRRGDVAGLRVYEVDHPDVQALKRARIAAATARPAALPEFVPVDFEVTGVGPALRAAGFDPDAAAIFSWMNTIPYLTLDATRKTLAEIARISAPGSRLVLNYPPLVELTAAQREFMQRVRSIVRSKGEPFVSAWKPADFEALLREFAFSVVEHASETDLGQRYFADRTDGLTTGPPARLVTAERTQL